MLIEVGLIQHDVGHGKLQKYVLWLKYCKSNNLPLAWASGNQLRHSRTIATFQYKTDHMQRRETMTDKGS